MATATIQVAYEAETSSLKATVNEINQINDVVVKGAQESATKVKDSLAALLIPSLLHSAEARRRRQSTTKRRQSTNLDNQARP